MTNNERKKLIQNYYRVRSKDYDKQKARTWKSEKGFGTEVFKELLDTFNGFDNKQLLEIGVGSGRNAGPLLEKIRLHLVGLDLTKEMLLKTKSKLLVQKDCLDLILGDAEHLPVTSGKFDGILCMSTMHYFKDLESVLRSISFALKENGTFFYGDLTPHELDDQEFFEGLERTISKAHFRYNKPSEMKRLLEKQGFHIVKLKTIPYRKSYEALIEDKAIYFEVKAEELLRYAKNASQIARRQYDLTEEDLIQYYTIIAATKGPNLRTRKCLKKPEV